MISKKRFVILVVITPNLAKLNLFVIATIKSTKEIKLASLRMYNEEEEARGTCRVRVKTVNETGKENPFYDRICDLIDCEKEPWDQFSFKASDAVYERADKLHERLSGVVII